MITLALISAVAIVLVGMIIGVWFWSIFIIITFGFLTVLVVTLCKSFINEKLRATHFCLAILLRARNNSKFLKHGLELRPGFLGEWIEIRFFNKPMIEYLAFVNKRVSR